MANSEEWVETTWTPFTQPGGSDEPVTVPVMPSGLERADMPETVLDGRLGEIYQKRLSRFPRAYAWGALVTAAGVLMPRGSAMQSLPIRSNLFFSGVGPVGTGKSQAMETAFGLLDLNEMLLTAKFGSAEAMAEKLEPAGPCRRLLYPDELRHLLEKAAIEGASFTHVLNTAYYRDQQIGGAKKNPFAIDCRLSIAGGLVEDNFADSFGCTSTGGLYDRFIFGLCPQPYQYLYRPFEGSIEVLEPLPAPVTGGVWETRDQWVKDGIPARVAEHALRAAYVCAGVDRRRELTASQLGPALAFANYQAKVRKVLKPNPGENPDATCAVKIRAWLEEHAGAWVTRRDLDRGIHADRLGPNIFNRCLTALAFNDEIELDKTGKKLRLRPPEDK